MKKKILPYAIGVSLLISNVWAGDVEVSLPAATDAFTVDQPAGTELMRVHGDGNVGIGTATPGATLHISNSEPSILIQDTDGLATDLSKVGFIHFRDSAGDTTGFIGDGSSATNDMQISAGVNQQLRFYTNGTTGIDSQKVIINTDGDVGIGTDAPVANLHVEETEDGALGSVYVRTQSAAQTGASRYVTRTATAGAALQLYEANATGTTVGLPNANLFSLNSWGATGVDNMLIGTGTAPIHFSNGNPVGSIKMSILPDGDVGIGTTSPGEKFHVAGGDSGHILMDNRGAIRSIDANSTNVSLVSLYDNHVYVGVGAASTVTEDLILRTREDFVFRDETNTVLAILKGDTGNFGIGTTTPSTKLHVAGTITEDSDRRLKNNITPLDNSLEKIKQLQGVSFLWKDQEKYEKGTQLGLIAQDVEKIIPEVVKTSANDQGTKSVAYNDLIAVLIEGIKEQQTQIDTLQKRIDTLESQKK